MKKLLLASTFCLFLMPVHAHAASALQLGCGINAGQTLGIGIDAAQGTTMSVTIWDKGFEGLRGEERTVTITTPENGTTADKPNDMGKIEIRPTGTAPVGKTIVHFINLNLKAGGSANGYVQTPDGVKHNFSGVIAGDKANCD